MDAQNAVQSDQTKPSGASPQRSGPPAAPASPPAPLSPRPDHAASSAVNSIKPEPRNAADSSKAIDADSPQERDSDAETIVLPGKDGHSPSKARKVRQEDRSDDNGDVVKPSFKGLGISDGDKTSIPSRLTDGLKKKRLGSHLDRDKPPRSKDGSSGLSSAPTSPPHRQQRRRSVDPQSSSDSENSHQKQSSKPSLREKLKAGERLLPHKRKAPKPDSDDEADIRKARRQRTTSAGVDSGRMHKDHKSSSSSSSSRPHHEDRSISPQGRSHRRSASSQLLSQSSNGLAQKKKRLPPPLQSTEYHSDDSSASGSPHPRSSKLRNLATPAESNASPAKMAPHKKHLDAHGQTFLARACARGEYDVAKMRLTERPEDLNVADYAGNTPLQIAAINGCEDIVKLLIEAGCNLDCVNYDKDTPLLDAVDNGHLGVVKLLLDADVNPRKANVNGEEPIDRVSEDTENAAEIRAALLDAKKRHGERRRTSEDRHDHDPRDSHAPDSPRHSPAMAMSAFSGRRSGTVRSTKTRNDLLYMPLDEKTLRQAAGRGDEETVGRILQVKEGFDDPESMVAAARGGHDLVIQLLLGLGGAHPDPAPVSGLQQEFGTPMLAAIGQENIKVVELLLEQQTFDPTRKFKGETYYEIARQRMGANWKEEEHMLKNAYDEYKRTHKDSAKSRSPTRRERERDREEREAKRAKRAEAKEEARLQKRHRSSPSRDPEPKKKLSSKVSSPKDKRRSNSFGVHGEEQVQKRGPGRPRKEDRIPSINVSDREVSPTLVHKQLKTKRADSDAAGVSSEGEAVKPRRKLVSKGELRGEREKQRRASMASNASSLKDHPPSPHDLRHEEPDKHRADKLSEKYHDRTKALKRDESRDRLSVSGDGATKRHRTSVTPDRPSNGEKDDGEAPVKRRRLDAENREKRQKHNLSSDERPRKSTSSQDSTHKTSHKPNHKPHEEDRRAPPTLQRRDSDRSDSDKSIHVKSEDADIEMHDADSIKAVPHADAQELKDKEEREEKQRREAEEKARREVEEKRRIEEEKRKKKLEQEEARKREELEKQRKEDEEREAERKRKEEEEQRQRKEEEDRQRREAEEKARQEEEKRRVEEERKLKEEEEKRKKEEEMKRQEEEKKRQEEDDKKRKEEEERKQREEEERLHQEQIEREAAEWARRQREEDERKERERRERIHREELERKRAAREAEQKRLQEEQERARLEKLPPLLHWLDTCSNPKLPGIASKFHKMQGARYDTLRPEANGLPEGRDQWVLNTHVALLLGEKDLNLSRCELPGFNN